MFWNKIKANAPEIILLGATAALQFFRLGIGEIQSWDESLYLIRAEACVKFGAWLDQTQYAIGGLYSSTHPPLVIWMMAFMRMTFGNGVFVSRMISATAGVVALYFFYKLSGKFFSRWTRLFATVLLGTAQGFLWYSHHAQLDIPMFAFIVAAAYFAVRAFEESSSKLAIIAGALYGCALLTKAFQPLYLLSFLIALPYIFRSGKRYKKLAILLGTALIIALPWYLFMMIRHTDYFSDYAGLVGSMKAGTYAKESTTQWWYYINQIVINFPFLVLVPLVIPNLIQKWKERNTVYRRISLVNVLWFVGMIIFMSGFHTRMPHFVLFLFLPAALLFCVVIEQFLFLSDKKNLFRSAILIVVVFVWTASELIRKSIREHSIPSFHYDILLLIGIAGIAIIIIVFLFKYFSQSPQGIVMLITSVLFLSAAYYRLASRNNDTFVDGAEETGKILLSTGNIHSLIAYHDGYPHQSYLPQLNYYSEGLLIGWDTTRSEITKTWTEIDSLIKINAVPTSDAAIIYCGWDGFYKPKQEEIEILSRINQGLQDQYKRSFHSKKYQLYWDPK